MTDNTELLRELVELRTRNARLEEALKYYGNEENYVYEETSCPFELFPRIIADLDNGAKARTANEPSSPGFADKVLQFVAHSLEFGAVDHDLTPEEAKLLEGFADA